MAWPDVFFTVVPLAEELTLAIHANRSHVSPLEFLMPPDVFLITNSCQVAAAHAFHAHHQHLMPKLHEHHSACHAPCSPLQGLNRMTSHAKSSEQVMD